LVLLNCLYTIKKSGGQLKLFQQTFQLFSMPVVDWQALCKSVLEPFSEFFVLVVHNSDNLPKGVWTAQLLFGPAGGDWLAEHICLSLTN